MAKSPFPEFIPDLVLAIISKGKHFSESRQISLERAVSVPEKRINHWGFDDGQFDNIPTFSMGALEDGELRKLAIRILQVPDIACDCQ